MNTDTELYGSAASAQQLSSLGTPTPESNADAVDKRVLDLFIEDFEQSGVHLKDASDRQAFLKAAEKNLELSVQFNMVIFTFILW